MAPPFQASAATSATDSVTVTRQRLHVDQFELAGDRRIFASTAPAELRIIDGGRVVSCSQPSGLPFPNGIGDGFGSNGQVTVTGPGSSWTHGSVIHRGRRWHRRADDREWRPRHQHRRRDRQWKRLFTVYGTEFRDDHRPRIRMDQQRVNHRRQRQARRDDDFRRCRMLPAPMGLLPPVLVIWSQARRRFQSAARTRNGTSAAGCQSAAEASPPAGRR